jgi:hypothetical protein
MAIVLVACGGGSKSEQASPTTTAVAGPATPTTRPVDTSFTGQGSTEYCRLAKTYADASSRLGEAATADMRRMFRDAARDVKLAVDAAPGEIQSDVRIVADGFGALVDALETVDFDFTRLPPDLIARFLTEEFVTATVRVSQYNIRICRVSE